jgi:hypothetical protein
VKFTYTEEFARGVWMPFATNEPGLLAYIVDPNSTREAFMADPRMDFSVGGRPPSIADKARLWRLVEGQKQRIECIHAAGGEA